jgi:hypothetical protein
MHNMVERSSMRFDVAVFKLRNVAYKVALIPSRSFREFLIIIFLRISSEFRDHWLHYHLRCIFVFGDENFLDVERWRFKVPRQVLRKKRIDAVGWNVRLLFVLRSLHFTAKIELGNIIERDNTEWQIGGINCSSYVMKLKTPVSKSREIAKRICVLTICCIRGLS